MNKLSKIIFCLGMCASYVKAESLKDRLPLNLSENEMAYFVSFSMPEAQIVAAIKSAERNNIPVYINGLIGESMPKTAKAMLYLVQKHKVKGVLVDPMRFNYYGIASVPALAKKCGNKFDVVFGNANVEQLIELIDSEGDCKK